VIEKGQKGSSLYEVGNTKKKAQQRKRGGKHTKDALTYEGGETNLSKSSFCVTRSTERNPKRIEEKATKLVTGCKEGKSGRQSNAKVATERLSIAKKTRQASINQEEEAKEYGQQSGF